MSAWGQKRKSSIGHGMSAPGGEADVGRAALRVAEIQIPENRISESQKFCNRKSRNPENDFAPPILVSERGQPNLTLGLSARFKNVLPERATVIFATDFVVQEHQSGP